MSNSNQHVRERQRLDFAKIQSAIQIPNLIEVQMKSYQRFLQMDLLPSERDDGGLQSVFTSVFPIRSRSPFVSPSTTRTLTPARRPFATSRNRKFSTATFR